MDDIRLHIVSPERTLVDERVSRVSLPGVVSPFQVLKDHAPLITALDAGTVKYVTGGEEREIRIRTGFVQVGGNEVNVAVEV